MRQYPVAITYVDIACIKPRWHDAEMTEYGIEDGYERTVSGLLRKRAEIAGSVKAKQEEV